VRLHDLFILRRSGRLKACCRHTVTLNANSAEAKYSCNTPQRTRLENAVTDLTEHVGFDPTHPSTVQDPYPIYDQLRMDDPVHWSPKGFWFLSSYADVHACLNDPRLSNSPAPFALVHARNRDRFAAADIANNLIAFKDAPDHPKLRRWMARALAQHIMRIGPDLEQIAEGFTSELKLGQSIEVVAELAVPFAAGVICRVIGLPEEDAARVASWSDDFFKLFHAIPDAQEFGRLNESLGTFREYMLEQMARRENTAHEALISDLVSSPGNRSSPEEIADNLMLVAADGVGNVQSGLVNCLYVLLRQAVLPAELHGTAKERAAVVDECLRLESPGQYQGRITLQPIIIRGRTIRAHSVVLLGLAAANRDPAAFSNADRFDAARKRPQHLAFGHGAHSCVGNMLVRREISAMLSTLLSSGIKMAIPPEPMDWLARPGHRWMRRLDVKLGAAS
jgi:cytochrome P450